jgi:hypothetical protein
MCGVINIIRRVRERIVILCIVLEKILNFVFVYVYLSLIEEHH